MNKAMTAVTDVVVGVQTATGTDDGFGFTQNADGVFVRQRVELFEAVTGCETKNRYNLVTIPKGAAFPEKMDTAWSEPYKEAALSDRLYKAKEESQCFQRICCPVFRGFEMEFKTKEGATDFTIERPFKCDPCHCPPCCMLAEQELSVKGRDGVVITRAKERTANCQQCCSRTFIIYDGSEQELYRLKAGQCTSDSGNCNACAPSCCVNAYEVDMYQAGDEGKKIDTSAFLFPGCCTCAGATDRSNFVVKFPAEATTHQRAALLGGMFLVEYTIMELKRQQEKENNNQGGGGGGGAPEQQQMAR